MASLADAFRDLARWAEGTDPLYAHLCREAAADDAVLDLAATVPEGRQAPHLLLAAVHYLLARVDDAPLADYYPSLREDPRPLDEGCYPAFREFCRDRAGDLRPLLEARRTQTNAVRRSAVLYPALAHVAGQAGDRPLALVELGSSAGLNLVFDRYRYDYDGTTVGPAMAPVTIASHVRGGDPPLPAESPAVHSRVGIDLHPLDVTDPDDAAWLRALVWPAHTDRRALLDGAIEAVGADPPAILAGDAAERLPAVLDSIPHDVPVCVFNTLVRYQLSDEADEDLVALLRAAMAERPLHWLTGRPTFSGGESLCLDWVRAGDGGVQTDALVEFDPHGAWLDWQY